MVCPTRLLISLGSHAFLLPAEFFFNSFFGKNISGMPSEWQTVWIQFRPVILSGLIWVLTDCKGYQQTTLGVTELKGFNRMKFTKNETLRAVVSEFIVFASMNISGLKYT